MKIKLGLLSQNTQALSKLTMYDFGEPYLNFKLMKAADVIDDNLRKYQKVCQDILKKYSTTDSCEQFTVPREKMKPLNEEIKKAGNIEVEIDREPVEADIKSLGGFTAKDLKFLGGNFVEIKEKS